MWLGVSEVSVQVGGLRVDAKGDKDRRESEQVSGSSSRSSSSSSR